MKIVGFSVKGKPERIERERERAGLLFSKYLEGIL